MKRDKQDVAILILSILVAALLVTFLVVKVFDLKIGKITHQDVGQMDMYRRTVKIYRFSVRNCINHTAKI